MGKYGPDFAPPEMVRESSCPRTPLVHICVCHQADCLEGLPQNAACPYSCPCMMVRKVGGPCQLKGKVCACDCVIDFKLLSSRWCAPLHCPTEFCDTLADVAAG